MKLRNIVASFLAVVAMSVSCVDELSGDRGSIKLETSTSVMPVQGAWPVQDVIDLIRQYDFTGQRRVSFEYTMFAGFNDTKAHADALVRMLRGLECRMNLIRFHKIPDFPYETSPDVIIENFKNRLNNSGITTTIRASRGEDILAACGMLAGQHKDCD